MKKRGPTPPIGIDYTQFNQENQTDNEMSLPQSFPLGLEAPTLSSTFLPYAIFPIEFDTRPVYQPIQTKPNVNTNADLAKEERLVVENKPVVNSQSISPVQKLRETPSPLTTQSHKADKGLEHVTTPSPSLPDDFIFPMELESTHQPSSKHVVTLVGFSKEFPSSQDTSTFKRSKTIYGDLAELAKKKIV